MAAPAMREMRLRVFIGLFAFCGVVLSLYLLKEHYSPSAGTFCDINETISCTTVNQSAYSEILGIPLSFLGVLHYLFSLLIALTAPWISRQLGIRRRTIYLLLCCELAFGVLFSGYLSYLQDVVIKAWCPLCVASALLTTTNAILAVFLWKTQKR